MSRHSYRIFWIVLTALFIGFLIADFNRAPESKDTSAAKEEVTSRRKRKNGTVDTQDRSGRIKTRVNYENGFKHGLSYLFYENGQVQLAMPYVYGKREGISRKYYENGEIYAETPYEDDLLTGVRYLYYRNGSKKAELPYLHNWPGTGLVEYYPSGEKRDLSDSIRWIRERQSLKLIAPKACDRDITFFITDLIKGQFLNVRDPELIRIGQADGVGFVNLNVHTPSYLRFRDVVCYCTTQQGNEWVIKTKVDLMH